jgi:peroxiredoxin
MNFKRLAILVTFLSETFMTLNAQTANNLINKVVPVEKDRLELTGELQGLQEGETVVLRKIVYDKGSEFIDSVKVSDGKFYFQYHLDSGPQVFLIGFSKHRPFIALALGNEKAYLTSTVSLDAEPETNIVDYITVDGSKTFNDFVYVMGIKRIWYYSNQFISATISKIKDSNLTNDKLEYISGLLKAKQALGSSAIASLDYQPARDVIPVFFRDMNSDIQHSSGWPQIFNLLSDKAKKSFYGKWMSDRMPLCVGQQIPNFNFVPKDGSESSLNDIIKKNKLTILHFWANGSLDRVRIHGELAKAYSKYKSRGLEVVSVSLDANPEKWKRVIKEDKIPGYQTCDFKEEEGSIAQLYKMDPRSTVNILIDQNGKIIAWDVDGPALFGYLYKTFGE